MNPVQRPLHGCAVGLSISESEDCVARGFPSWQVNRTTLQVVAALFGQGARVVFGHDWREDGVMEAVHGFDLQMQGPDPLSSAADARQPMLQNLLPWPDKPRLPQVELDRLRATLSIEEAGLPDELRADRNRPGSAARDGIPYEYVRARGLTHLRHLLNQRVDARVCIGGRTGGSQGRYPGIVEEALIAVQDDKPLYLAGLLGGASRQLIDAIEEREMPGDFCHADAMKELYASQARMAVERNEATAADREVSPAHVWSTFSRVGISGFSRANKLSEKENRELFRTPALDRAIGLILTGLARVGETKRH